MKQKTKEPKPCNCVKMYSQEETEKREFEARLASIISESITAAIMARLNGLNQAIRNIEARLDAVETPRFKDVKAVS